MDSVEILPFGKPLEAMSTEEVVRYLDTLEVRLGQIEQLGARTRKNAAAAGDTQAVRTIDASAAADRVTLARVKALRASILTQLETV